MNPRCLNLLELEDLYGGDSWSNIYDCMASAYRDYGWWSGALWAVSIALPSYTVVAVAGACTGHLLVLGEL